MKIYWKIFLLLLLGCIGCSSQGRLTLSHYNFNVKIDPASQSIESILDLSYVQPFEKSDSITFLLHRNMAIESFEGSNIRSIRFDTSGTSTFQFTPEAGKLTVKLLRPLHKGEMTDIKLNYKGQIGIVSKWQTNRIMEDWVELGMYTPWFPYNPELSGESFEINLDIPAEYSVCANGKTMQNGSRWNIKSTEPDNDIIIAASKNIKSKSIVDRSHSLRLTSAIELSDSTLDNILSVGSNIFRKYSEWFGECRNPEASILITPRKTGGGYARKSLIVMGSMNDSDYVKSGLNYLRYFAHEFAHLWWSNAPADSWEDWLNESFAEYSAMLIIREMAGSEEFLSRIRKKGEKITSLPAIRGFDRKSPHAYDVLYNKGCYLLYLLETQIGRSRLLEHLKYTYSKKINSTEDFISGIKSEYGSQAAVRLDLSLNE